MDIGFKLNNIKATTV